MIGEEKFNKLKIVYYAVRYAFPYCPNLTVYRYDYFEEDKLKY